MSPFIVWVIVVAILVGSLLYLLKRPHLNGEQKLVTLLVASAISVPLGGLLMVPLGFVVWDLWERGIPDAMTRVVFFGPPVAVVGIGIFVGGSIADQREARKADEGTAVSSE